MFETERCIIHPFQTSDSHDVQKLYVNREVRKYLGGILHENSIKESIKSMLYPDEDAYYWTVREKRTNHFIGLLSLDAHYDGVSQEISYQFLPDWWGKGYATEVVEKTINHCFNELKLSKIVAETQTANQSSCRLLEKMGMKKGQIVHRFGTEQVIYTMESRTVRKNITEENV